MNPKVRRFYIAASLLLVIGGLVTISLLQPVVGTRTEFSIYNTKWNGVSELARDAYAAQGFVPAFGVAFEEDNVTIVHRSFETLGLTASTSSLLILAPTTPPTASEAAWLNAFLDAGGRLALADDFGEGNRFLEAVHATSRFQPGVVMDLAYAKQPRFVVATNFTPHQLTMGIGEIVLDHASSIQVGQNATILATTSETSWIDRNDDGIPQPTEPIGPFVWMAMEQVGRGDILLISDPSIFINGMRGLADDRDLASRLLTWLTEEGRGAVFDESHRDYTDPVRLLGSTLGRVPEGIRLPLAMGAMAMFLALTIMDWGQLLSRPRTKLARIVSKWSTESAPAGPSALDAVLKRHPDWDENTLRRILNGWSEEHGNEGDRGRP